MLNHTPSPFPHLPVAQPLQSLPSASPPLILLAWRWSTRWSVIVFVRVHVLRWLHLDIIAATKVALVRTPILVLVVRTLLILIPVLWRLLTLLILFVGWRWPCERKVPDETCPEVWLTSCLSSSSLRDTARQTVSDELEVVEQEHLRADKEE